MSVAHLQVLHMAPGVCRKLKRDAVPTVAYSYGYNTLSYYLASACDQIYLAPGGDLFFTGMNLRDACLHTFSP